MYIPKCNGGNMVWNMDKTGKLVSCPKCGADVKLKKGGQFRKHLPLG